MQHKIEEVFDEIHRSNMSKLGEDGKPLYREDGKVLKGPNYFRPDIKKIIGDSEW
jgi:predicted HAD superfamily Cof-like phosphohydrolase